MAARKVSNEQPGRRRPPAKTPEERERQIISAAYDLAERQIAAGTVSSQVHSHFLKAGSTSERKDLEKKDQEIALLRSKVKQLAQIADQAEMYKAALLAMSSYQGKDPEDGQIPGT